MKAQQGSVLNAMSELKIGSTLRLSNGETAIVKKRLGDGGQGIVYQVIVNGQKMALKWYKMHPGAAFRKNLAENIHRSAPADNFIWPVALTEEKFGSFGYVMKLRPKGYVDMSEFILLHARFKDVHAQLNACLQICEAFQSLHLVGLSYQDMNDGNFCINPDTGDVLICDNDNVAPDKTSMGVLGKAGYMAPEIIEGVARPNRYTDYYSLAVCLFILIYMNRPFEGAYYASCPCDNTPEMAKKLFGFGSVFIMDPANAKNRPVPGAHNNVIRRWGVYPNLLARAFCKTFSSQAINDPTQRLMDKQWYNILLQVRSMYAKCPHCGNETFIDVTNPGGGCIYCQKELRVPALKVGRFSIPLVEKQPLYACLVSDEKDRDAVVGHVVEKKGESGVKNTSASPWTLILPDSSVKIIGKGDGVPARAGLKVRFGQGEIGEFINN